MKKSKGAAAGFFALLWTCAAFLPVCAQTAEESLILEAAKTQAQEPAQTEFDTKEEILPDNAKESGRPKNGAPDGREQTGGMQENEEEQEEPESREQTEGAGQSESPQKDGVPVLADTNAEAQVVVCAPDDCTFPMGSSLRLLTIPDMIEECAQKEERCRKLEEQLQNFWADTLGETEYIRTFLPFYVMALDKDGSELALPQKAEVRFTIKDPSFYEEAKERDDHYKAAWQGKGERFSILADEEVFRDDARRLVEIHIQTEDLGWFCLAQIADSAKETGQEAQTEPAAQTETQHMQEAQTDSGEITEPESFSEPESETAQTELWDQKPELGIVYAALTPTGTKVTASASTFRKMQPSNLDGGYRAARWYPGISSFVPFSDAGAAVKQINSTLGGGTYLYYPVNNSAKGKFGGIYKKILYQDGQWYDLKITVTDYTDHTYAGTDGDEVPSYPPMGFCRNALRWYFKPMMGEYVMKMTYQKNGDSSGAAVKLNTRFQWWEIDNHQRFGLRVSDGKIAVKYYQTDQCVVYYQSQNADVDGKSYLFVTASGDLPETDKRGNVGFALNNCSTCYVAIGYKDQIRESAESRASKATIEEWNDSLKSGNASGMQFGVLKQSDVDVPIPFDTAYPQKSVSNDKAAWGTQNTLPAADSAYYYRIRQYVPWQTSSNYYRTFSITDQLPQGADYVGNLSVCRVEDQADVTAQFICSADGSTVNVSATDAFLNNSGFYGYTFDICFQVRMNPDQIEAAYEKNAAVYRVSNTAFTEAAFQNGAGSYRNQSNSVTTTAFVTRNDPAPPQKGLDQDAAQTVKELESAKEEIVFSIFQEIPQNGPLWQPAAVTFQDTFADCLEYRGAKVYEREAENYRESEGWTAQAAGQEVRITREFQPGASAYRVDLTCAIRDGYDLESYIRKEGNRLWYVIPNTAQTEFQWAHGDPAAVTGQTNEALVKLYARPAAARLKLTKEIDTADIVWAHGNPVFTFKVEGEDIDAKKHTYYETVEFAPENVKPLPRTTLTADITVPAGWYTAGEEQTMRYRLGSIHSIRGGILSADTVVFDVSSAGEACATFYNAKTTDEGESHSVFVRNHIGE